MIVPIDQVIADSRCQSRTGIDLGLVHDYAEAIKSGADMPPLSVIDSGDGLYLYDGFHRIEAYRQAGVKQVPVSAEPGDMWDAIERSCAVNAVHGKRRTQEDTKNAVGKILQVMKHRGEKWNQTQIAEKCAITQQRVSQILNGDPSYKDLYDSAAEATTVTRGGSTYEMNTANIGKHRAPKIDLEGLDFDNEDVDEETGEIRDPAPAPRPGIAPKTKDNYHPSVVPDTWFEIPSHDGEMAYRYIQRNMLPEAFEVLRLQFKEGVQ